MQTDISAKNELIGFSHIDNGATTPVYCSTHTWRRFLVWGGEGHYGYPDFPSQRDVGGAFNLVANERIYGTIPGTIIRASGPYSNYHYRGTIVTDALGLGDAAQQDGSAYGATAYDRMKPTKPNFNGFNAIWELKDLPGMFEMTLRNSPLLDISNYWLALKFGWEPLMRDIISLVKTQMDAQKRLSQLIRDNGRPVRRRITLADTAVPTYTASGSSYAVVVAPSMVTYFFSGTPRYTDTISSVNRVWASGQYRYWLPSGPRDINWTNEMKRRIFGLYPTPRQLYNSIPWSWLIDWFTNLGDVLNNLSAEVADRLAADYFYVMRESGSVATRQVEVPLYDEGLNPITLSATGITRSTNKTRLRGDPFGLNTAQNTLSGMQLSILGALGMSRVH